MCIGDLQVLDHCDPAIMLPALFVCLFVCLLACLFVCLFVQSVYIISLQVNNTFIHLKHRGQRTSGVSSSELSAMKLPHCTYMKMYMFYADDF